jgi:hypothetical protein
MTLLQTAKNNMYKAVKAFLESKAAAFNGFKRAQTEIAAFNKQNKALDDYINEQAGSSKGMTSQKNTLLENLVQLTLKSSRKALVYAIDQDDDVLQQLFNVQVHDLVKSSVTKTLAAVQNIYAALQPLSGQLDEYRVTADDITAIGNAVDAFKAAEGTPEIAQAFAEAGTKGIEATMPLMDKNLHLLDDLIIHGMDEDPDLIREYRKVRRVKETGSRHTGLIATINDAASGKGIEGATMLVQDLNKKATSDILGVADIESIKPGMYHIIFTADGYAPQTQILKIEQGKTLDEEVRMVKE